MAQAKDLLVSLGNKRPEACPSPNWMHRELVRSLCPMGRAKIRQLLPVPVVLGRNVQLPSRAIGGRPSLNGRANEVIQVQLPR